MPTHYRGSDNEQLALQVFITLSRASESYQHAALERAPLPDGLTLSQFGVLEALLHLGPLPQTEVCGKLLKSKGNISVVVRHLETRGLVRRTAIEGDRRQRQLDLTDSGRELISAYFPNLARGFTDAVGVLTPDEQRTLVSLCKKLGRGVQQTS